MVALSTDQVMESVIRIAIEILGAQKVILFGSRSRGDYLERSDYDFAILPAPHLSGQWGRFTLAIHEKVPTLHHIDLVNLAEELAPEFSRRIQQEGKVLHGT